MMKMIRWPRSLQVRAGLVAVCCDDRLDARPTRRKWLCVLLLPCPREETSWRNEPEAKSPRQENQLGCRKIKVNYGPVIAPQKIVRALCHQTPPPPLNGGPPLPTLLLPASKSPLVSYFFALYWFIGSMIIHLRPPVCKKGVAAAFRNGSSLNCDSGHV